MKQHNRNAILLIALLLCVPFTFASINYCISFGKLRHDVTYDDVNYYVYGLHLYRALFDGGIYGAAEAFLSSAPRSLYSAWTAALAFTVFGVTDWSPLAMNIVVVALLVCSALLIVRGAPPLVQGAVMIYVFASPLSMMAVTEFRPDILSSLLLFMAPTYLFFANESSPRTYDFLVSGALVGATFLAKSTIFPLIVAVAMVTFLVGCILRRLSDQRPTKYWVADVLQLLCVFFVSAIVVALPQIYNAKFMIEYLLRTISGREAEVWATTGTWPFIITYYLTGDGTRGVSSHYAISWITGFIGVLCVLMFEQRKNLRIACVAWVALLFFNYAVLTAANIRSPFLGLPFLMYIFMAPVVALRFISRSPVNLVRSVALPCVAVIAASALFFASPSVTMDSKTWLLANDGPRQKAIHQDLLAVITSDFSRQSGPRSLYLQMTGFTNFDTVKWLAYRDSLPFSEIHGADPIMSLGEMQKRLRDFDYTIALESQAVGTYTWYPSNRIGAELVASLDASDDLKRIGAVRSQSGPKYVVYRNVAREARRKFSGWKDVTGAMIYENPKYLLGIADNIDFTLRREPVENGEFAVRLYSKSYEPSRTDVYLNDQKVAEFRFTDYNEMAAKTIPLGTLEGGERLSFRTSEGKFDIGSDGKIFSVVFEEARLLQNHAKADAGAGGTRRERQP